MNSLEIAECLSQDAFAKRIFKGVFAADSLPTKVSYPSLFVVNTAGSGHPGKHWVCIYLSVNKRCEYLDSIGKPPRKPYHLDFIKKHAQECDYSRHRYQSLVSDVCGQYCVLYALNRSRGVPLRAFLNKFSKRLYDKNDNLVRRLFHHTYPKYAQNTDKSPLDFQKCCRPAET